MMLSAAGGRRWREAGGGGITGFSACLNKHNTHTHHSRWQTMSMEVRRVGFESFNSVANKQT